MERPKGYSCIAEKRAIEISQDGALKIDYMRFSETIRIEVRRNDGQSIFGAIEHEVEPQA